MVEDKRVVTAPASPDHANVERPPKGIKVWSLWIHKHSKDWLQWIREHSKVSPKKAPLLRPYPALGRGALLSILHEGFPWGKII